MKEKDWNKLSIHKSLFNMNNNNIFEGAKFGDRFLTRSGRPALYLHQCTKIFGQDCGHHLVIFTDADTYASNGKLWNYKNDDLEHEFDIISKDIEPIDEDKLAEIAIKNSNICSNYEECINCSMNECYHKGFYKGFIAGYHKAKEE